MYGQPAKSYRLGDLAGGGATGDGDYVAMIKTIEPSATRDGKPQLKVSAVLVGGKPHTWWYNLGEDSIFRLAQDLLAVGIPESTDLGQPPFNAATLAQALTPVLLNQTFSINVTTKGDFSNTKIRGRVAIGPDGQPAGAPAGTPTAPGGPAHGAPAMNVTEPAGLPVGPPPAMAFGSAPPVNPGAPQQLTGVANVDPAHLFRQA